MPLAARAEEIAATTSIAANIKIERARIVMHLLGPLSSHRC